ncbi:fetuin B [Latimeria chalumnae]|uniref:fetuin B n=1 Tax=Latimeria chalumnae TaxID=7897 RepID=UPI0003C18D2D|nr:PREDICTED: fetuin-B-like [Latimeria chalumnae]|eukprot:XP_005989460.1 PREDICTED: fetuin-B-like [Latimeria chalumnae]
MKLYIVLFLCTQIFYSWAEPPPSSSLQSPPCNSQAIESIADLALRKINKDRKQGYIFSLLRVASVYEQQQEPTGNVYYLTIDVLETDCHVLSKKLWKDCENKQQHETVYGECKAILYVNRPGRIVKLYSYNCTVRPVSSSQIHQICPDCPAKISVDENTVVEATDLILQRYNKESNTKNYFSLLSITAASMQWMVGASYFVEFSIQETSCSKNKPQADISKCAPLDCEFKHTGFCKGSVMNTPGGRHVEASCEIYEPEAAAKEKKNHEQEQDQGHAHHHYHEGSHGHPDGHEHKHTHLHEHEHHHHETPDEALKPMPLLFSQPEQIGHVDYLPAVETTNLPSSADAPVVQKSMKPVPLPSVPDAPTNPVEQVAVTLPILSDMTDQPNKPSKPLFAVDPVILPFPDKPSESEGCPGQLKYQVPYIMHLLSIPVKRPEAAADVHV